jgi:hypothetical protein
MALPARRERVCSILPFNRCSRCNLAQVLKNSIFQKSGEIWWIGNVEPNRENRLQGILTPSDFYGFM